MARILQATSVALISVLAAILYSRANVLCLFYSNTPGRLERVNNLKGLDVKFGNVVRNCEDVILNEDAGFALISCDPGRDKWNTVMGTFLDPKPPAETGLYLWTYGDSNPSSPPQKLKLLDFKADAKDFHPLGVDYHAPSQSLFVVNHAEGGSRVEIFKLFPSKFAATHVKTIEDPLLAAPNSVVAVSDQELFVTNDHNFRRRYNPLLAVLETYLGLPGGSIVHVTLDSVKTGSASSTQLVARVPFANGIVLLNSTTLAVASSSLNAAILYTIDRDDQNAGPRLSRARTIPVPFHADNLSVDGNGKLLIAGHPHAPTLEKFARKSAFCNDPAQVNNTDCSERGLSWIAEWSEEGGLKTLYSGAEFATSTTAVRDVGRGVGFATGLYERGILAWRE